MSSSVTSRCVTARMTVGWIVVESPTPAVGEPSERVRPVEAEPRRVDLDEVRLDLLEIDRHSRLVDRLGERPRPLVILRQPLDVVVERVQTRSRDDAGLSHGAAEQVLLPPRAGHELLRTGEQRPERAPEPLREAERHGVEARGDGGRLDTERNGCVEEAGAVEVDGETDLPRRRDDILEVGERPDASARAVVRVLERKHRGALVGHLRARLRSQRGPAPTSAGRDPRGARAS